MTIKIFNLCCAAGHLFEGWFASSDEFERQRAAGLIECPQCGNTEVEKRPSASRIAHKKAAVDAVRQLEAARERLMTQVRRQAENAEDVGEKFVQESREIARGKAPQRNIKGLCTSAQAVELLEEGIVVLPVPESSGKTIN